MEDYFNALLSDEQKRFLDEQIERVSQDEYSRAALIAAEKFNYEKLNCKERRCSRKDYNNFLRAAYILYKLKQNINTDFLSKAQVIIQSGTHDKEMCYNPKCSDPNIAEECPYTCGPDPRRYTQLSNRAAAPAAPRPSRPSKGAASKFGTSKLSRKSKASRIAPAGKLSTMRNAIESSQSSGIRYGSRGTASSKKVSRIPTDSAIDDLVEQVHMMKISSPTQTTLSQRFKPSLHPISESPEDAVRKEAEANREWLKQKRDKMLRMLLIPANKPELYGESYGFGPYMKNIKKIKRICESTKNLGSTRLFEQACKQAKIGVDPVRMRNLQSELRSKIHCSRSTAYGKKRKIKGKGTKKKDLKKNK